MGLVFKEYGFSLPINYVSNSHRVRVERGQTTFSEYFLNVVCPIYSFLDLTQQRTDCSSNPCRF